MIVTFFDEHHVELDRFKIEGEGKYAIPLEAMYFRVEPGLVEWAHED